MSDNKTQPTKASVEKFLKGIADGKKRSDALALLKLMQQVTRLPAVMWGPSIVGFGRYHYKYASGREGDFFLTGFSPRKQNLTVYIMSGFKRYPALMKKLGTYTTGSSCLYIKRLEDVDRAVLKELIATSVKDMAKAYPE